jgi:NADPH-dependent 2,4-dienoyl-CoA reductase/sulfur reductase-like enzyme
MNHPTRITILGAGFGALSTVRALRHRDPRAEITLVAPRAAVRPPVGASGHRPSRQPKIGPVTRVLVYRSIKFVP